MRKRDKGEAESENEGERMMDRREDLGSRQTGISTMQTMDEKLG